MENLLYFLIFTFGYITCRTFYFLNAARKSILMIKATRLICLAWLSKTMEHFSYARTLRLFHMNEAKESEHNITAFKIRFDKELVHYKWKAVQNLLDLNPPFFKDTLEFDDWSSGMEYLELNKEMVLELLDDDK